MSESDKIKTRYKRYYNKNKNAINERCRQYYQRNKTYINKKRAVYIKDWIKNNPDKRKNYVAKYDRKNSRKKYGLTLNDYEMLLARQGGVCAICHKPETVKKRGKIMSLAVDHNHETGKVRGLLCCKCNRGIGLLSDDKSILAAAILYLSINEN